MLIVTQVAPYADGPAGVHGVLAQATTALCQLAEIAGLSPVVVDDVRDLSPHQLGATGVLALFTIGETPFSPAQKSALLDSWHAGRLNVLGVHSATDACHTWPDYGSTTPIAVAEITPIAAVSTVVTATMKVSTIHMAAMLATIVITATTQTTAGITPTSLTGITVADAAGCIATP